jgi:hypothetical protein
MVVSPLDVVQYQYRETGEPHGGTLESTEDDKE